MHLNHKPKYLDCQGPGPFTDTAIYPQEEHHPHVLTHKNTNGAASPQTAASFNLMATHGSALTKINANQVYVLQLENIFLKSLM